MTSDKQMLETFRDLVDNTKNTTERCPSSFFENFSTLNTDLNRVSRHLKNEGLRKTYFHMATLQTPFKVYLDYELQNMLINGIEEVGEEEIKKYKAVSKELILDSTNDITVASIGDTKGRNVINTEQLQADIGAHWDSENPISGHVLNRITEVFRNSYDEFVDEYSQEIVQFYEDVIESSETGLDNLDSDPWVPVLETISDKTVEVDNKALIWRREGQTSKGGYDGSSL